MSLKAFHVVFVAVVLILSLGVGVWGVRLQEFEGQGWPLILGVAALGLAFLTAIYGVWFLKKLKNVSYV